MAPDTYTPARRELVAQLLFVMQCILEDAGQGTEACGFRYMGNLLTSEELWDGTLRWQIPSKWEKFSPLVPALSDQRTQSLGTLKLLSWDIAYFGGDSEIPDLQGRLDRMVRKYQESEP